MSAAVRRKRAESWNAISRAALSSTSLVALAAMLASMPHSADAANECGAPVGGVVTCSGSSYPSPGISYNVNGITVVLNNSNLVARKTTAGLGAVYVVGGGINVNDIVINALLFQSVQATASLTNGLFAVNNGTAGNSIIRMDAGSVTTASTGAGTGALNAQINNSLGTGNAVITLNGGQVTNTGVGGHGVSALNAGTGNAAVTMNGGAVSTNTGVGLRAIVSNTTSFGTASVAISGASVMTTSGTGVLSQSERGNAGITMTAGNVTVQGGANPALTAVVNNAAGTGTASIAMSGGTVTNNGSGDGIFANNKGTGTYNISVTGGTVTGGSGTGAAIHAAAASGGTIAIGSDAVVNAGASGIAVSQTGGAATITTAGTVTGDINLSSAANTLSFTGGTIDGNISGGGNTALSFDLGTGSFTYDAAYAISGMGSVAMNSGSAEIGGSLATNTLAVNGGSLILNGAASVSSGTTISAGTLQLGNGGSSGSITGDVTNNGTLAFNRSDAYIFDGIISGSGAIRQIGSGLTRLTGDSSGFTGTTSVEAGTLSVNGNVCGDMNVLSGGRLQGVGTVCDTDNAGIIAPGNSIGTLTVSGNYVGNGGTLEIETVLGNDASATDRLVVTGNASGSTNVKVVNVGGGGAQTIEGIKIVDVGGTSNGTFSLLGDYVFQGDQAVVAGAYAYRLYKNGVGTPSDGDWYLRSTLINGSGAGASPLYAPGVPLYESYAGVLQSFNQLGTLQQRTGSRSWTAGDGNVDENTSPLGIWGRIETAHSHLEPGTSTTSTDYDSNIWKLETGADGALAESAAGALIGGFSVHYGTASADVSSLCGTGDIDATGYGLGGTMTWYGNSGLYLDAQGQLTWYDSDLHSDDLSRTLTKGNDGFGYAVSIEAGQKISLGTQWSLTPQAQLSYSSVRFEDFTDPYGAAVSLGDGDTLLGRLGLSVDYENEWKDAKGRASRASGYGIANLYYDFLDGSDVDVSGTRFVSENRALWGGLGLGGSYNWSDERYSINGEAFARTSLQDFGDSYSIGGKVSFNVKW
ncbi:autotransporter outer membrane beta-barrel domain-containing protein [Rhizobium sp. MC63]|uniref:Autotransporter outer membrane beta-barrel domain-containing protein n=1 Tax=Rhizobium mulingense TaxID=3031128 RepID=A0ACC6N211_9HYPH|nr:MULTISPECIES: autotransporter outer membrane beta-barrel domain-containing protein [unclassified Rhizobium]MDF0699399.1 autotransporter outer membrane beta-barrel domain-containing protein [Rhizobium sp. MC63]MEA3519716.1 autotransporter outer membrane beta-barrel domain-containing protein [Rhizobium sp. MJ31]